MADPVLRLLSRSNPLVSMCSWVRWVGGEGVCDQVIYWSTFATAFVQGCAVSLFPACVSGQRVMSAHPLWHITHWH